MLEDAGRGVVLTNSWLVPSFQSAEPTQIVIAEDEPAAVSDREENPQQVAGPTNLAYVMYTSG